MLLRVGKWKYYYESGNLRQISSYSRDGQRLVNGLNMMKVAKL